MKLNTLLLNTTALVMLNEVDGVLCVSAVSGIVKAKYSTSLAGTWKLHPFLGRGKKCQCQGSAL